MVSAYSPRAKPQTNHFFSFCPLLYSTAQIQVSKPTWLHIKAVIPLQPLKPPAAPLVGQSTMTGQQQGVLVFVALVRLQCCLAPGCSRAGAQQPQVCYGGELSPALRWQQQDKRTLMCKSPFCIQQVPVRVQCPLAGGDAHRLRTLWKHCSLHRARE